MRFGGIYLCGTCTIMWCAMCALETKHTMKNKITIKKMN